MVKGECRRPKSVDISGRFTRDWVFSAYVCRCTGLLGDCLRCYKGRSRGLLSDCLEAALKIRAPKTMINVSTRLHTLQFGHNWLHKAKLMSIRSIRSFIQ